jgi:hypothetical protein
MGQRSLAPLTGALFVVLVVVAFIPLGGSTPDGDASAAKVVSFYSDNDTREIIAAVLLALSTVPLLYFAALVRNLLSEALPDSSALPSFALGAGAVTAGGFLVAAGIHFTLADYADNIRPVALQAINALDSDLFLAFTTGVAAFVLAVSLGSRRTGVLPAWLAWVGIVLFIVFFTPVGFIAFGLSGIWIIVASVLLYTRGGARAAAGPATPD